MTTYQLYCCYKKNIFKMFARRYNEKSLFYEEILVWYGLSQK